jgi:hypothetical protein
VPAEPGNAQQHLARRRVHVDRPQFGVTQRPRELRIQPQVEIRPRVGDELVH